MKARQGDILITAIDQLPKGLKQVISGVILEGESTGHKHRIVGGELFKDNSGEMFLNVSSKAQIVHEEHNTLTLKKGSYAVIRQKEYLMKDMVRTVID